MPIESFVTTLIDWTFFLMMRTKLAFVGFVAAGNSMWHQDLHDPCLVVTDMLHLILLLSKSFSLDRNLSIPRMILSLNFLEVIFPFFYLDPAWRNRLVVRAVALLSNKTGWKCRNITIHSSKFCCWKVLIMEERPRWFPWRAVTSSHKSHSYIGELSDGVCYWDSASLQDTARRSSDRCETVKLGFSDVNPALSTCLPTRERQVSQSIRETISKGE